MADYTAYDEGLPCKNPACASHGKPHPNCKCYSGMAEGGEVKRFCDSMQPHKPGCEYYDDGGEIQPQLPPPQPSPQFVDNPNVTIGHAAVHHGLLGLMKDVGQEKMADPEKHAKILQQAKDQHEWRQSPNEMPLPNTLGVRLGNHIADGNHDKAADILADHALSGNMSRSKLRPIMERMAQPLISQDPDPEAFRGSVQYLGDAIKGQDQLGKYVSGMLGSKKSDKLISDEKMRDSFKQHMTDVGSNPSLLLESGGTLGHYLPAHAAAVGALTSTAHDYFQSLMPMKTQSHPLDRVMPEDKMAENMMNRQIDIANKPLLALQHVKNGTLVPQDVTTMKTLYPGLYKAVVEKSTEAIINAKTEKREIPYKQKFTLSMLLGQPMDSTMTPQALQAIMKSQAAQQVQQQVKAQPKQKKASGVELKQIDKVNSMDETKLQAREANRKE